MKFFKHFADAHEGKSMMALMAKFGVEGYGAFFILTEICTEKLEKETAQEFTEAHLKFIFNERLVREKLRMRSTKVELFLNYCTTLDLLQFTKVEDEFHFYFPKLLESMDRDSKRARQARGSAAPKPRQEQDQEEDKDKEPEQDQDSNEAEPILEFLDSISGDNVELTTALITSVLERIHDDVFPLVTKDGREEGTQALLNQVAFVIDLKNIYRAAKAYRNYVLKNKVERVYGFKKFAEEWQKWIPKADRRVTP